MVVEVFNHVFGIEGFVEAEDDFAGVVLQVFLAVGEKDGLDLFPVVARGGGQRRNELLMGLFALEVYTAAKLVENLV